MLKLPLSRWSVETDKVPLRHSSWPSPPSMDRSIDSNVPSTVSPVTGSTRLKRMGSLPATQGDVQPTARTDETEFQLMCPLELVRLSPATNCDWLDAKARPLCPGGGLVVAVPF